MKWRVAISLRVLRAPTDAGVVQRYCAGEMWPTSARWNQFAKRCKGGRAKALPVQQVVELSRQPVAPSRRHAVNESQRKSKSLVRRRVSAPTGYTEDPFKGVLLRDVEAHTPAGPIHRRAPILRFSGRDRLILIRSSGNPHWAPAPSSGSCPATNRSHGRLDLVGNSWTITQQIARQIKRED